MDTGTGFVGIGNSDGRLADVSDCRIFWILQCDYGLFADDGVRNKRTAPIRYIDISSVSVLHTGRIFTSLVDASKGEAADIAFGPVSSGLSQHRGNSGKLCESLDDDHILMIFQDLHLFRQKILIKLKKIFKKLSQHLEMEESGKSRCCDLLCKSVKKWVSGGKNVFDFMEK